MTVTPSEQVESRLQEKDDLDQVSISDFYKSIRGSIYIDPSSLMAYVSARPQLL